MKKKELFFITLVALVYVFILIILGSFLRMDTTGQVRSATVVAINIPVISGVYGFGINTPAGRGGVVYKVTNLNDSGTGSLRWALTQTGGPRVVVFEISGVIKLSSNLYVDQPFVTIAGQTAPKPGIMLAGATLVIRTHDVLVQHLRIRPGDDPNGPSSTNRDAFSIAASGKNPTNIVVDHCTFNWSIDEGVETWYDVGDITFNKCIFAEPLDDSIHVDEGKSAGIYDAHGYNFIAGYGNPDARLLINGSLFAHSRGRNPMSYAPNLLLTNNVMYNTIQGFTTLYNLENYSSKSDIIGNVYISGPSRASWATEKAVTISNLFYNASRLYMADNYSPSFTYSDQWGLVVNNSTVPIDEIKSTTRLVPLDGFTPIFSNQVLDDVLNNVGARPIERDSVETRIISDVRNRTGTLKNSVVEAGGWPVYANNQRALILPSDPNGDSDGDGYTNIEEWLMVYANQVEGKTVSVPITPIPTSVIKPTATPTVKPVLIYTISLYGCSSMMLYANESSCKFSALVRDVSSGTVSADNIVYSIDGNPVGLRVTSTGLVYLDPLSVKVSSFTLRATLVGNTSVTTTKQVVIVKPTVTPTPIPTSIPTPTPISITIKPTATPTPTNVGGTTAVDTGYKAEAWNYSRGWFIGIPSYRSPVVTTQVSAINFNWGEGSPTAKINKDKFIARFTGTKSFEAGKYQFTTTSDDGVRLWVDDQLIINQWTRHSAQMDTASLDLTAGTHKIRLEYFEYQGNALIRMGIKKM